MKRFLPFILLLFLSATASAQMTKSAIVSAVNNDFPSGCSQCITAALLRTVFIDVINSYWDFNGNASFTCASNTWVSAGTTTQQTCTQPAFSNLSNYQQNEVSNLDLALTPAYTFKGNATSGSATPTDFTIGSLTKKVTPNSSDLLVISDQAASGATKYITVGSLPQSLTTTIGLGSTVVSGVTANNELVGTGTDSGGNGTATGYTVGTGLTVTANSVTVSAPVNATVPQVCDIVSTSATTCNNGGSAANNGTYTVPSGAVWIEVTMVGGGGGGGGGNNAGGGNGSATCWNTSGAACSSPLYTAGAGSGGAASNSTSGGGGAGGTTAGACTPGVSGATGGAGNVSGANLEYATGGKGGDTIFGGGGSGSSSATGSAYNGAINSGGGGGGGGVTYATNYGYAGSGGGGGGSCKFILSSLASSYTYAVGGGGSAGSAGTGGTTGGAGAAGHIIVIAHFNY